MAGLLGSTAAFTVFMVEAPKTLDYGLLRQHGFTTTIDEDGTRSGWVGVGNAVDVDFAVGIDHGQFAAFSLRVDTRKVPSAALKLQLDEALQQEEQVIGKKVPRARKKELKEEITLMLQSRAVWTPTLTDCLWDLEAGLLLIFASGKKAEATQERFRETFGIAPEALSSGPMQDFFSRLFNGDVPCGDWSLAYADAASLSQSDAAATVVNTSATLETALGEGLDIQKIRLTATQGSVELEFALDASLTVSGLKLPKAQKGADDAATLLLKADTCSMVARLVKTLAV